MGIKDKREAVLEKIYDELLKGDLDDFKQNGYPSFGSDAKKGQQPLVQLIDTLEKANTAEEEAHIKEDALDFDNAHNELERQQEERTELIKLLVTSGITIATNLVWGMIFVHELNATRLFEKDGTETSAAGRWLKQSFPKFGRL